jgi:hypothetical protein
MVYGAIFTIVEECSNALTGVGATMAPKSQLENGICAPFIKAAIAINATGKIILVFAELAINSEK